MLAKSLSEERATLAYVAAAKPCFLSLQETMARLAGLLMTAELKASRHVLETQSLAEAEVQLSRALERFGALAPDDKCRHFHHHLSKSVSHLGEAMTAAEKQRAGLVGARDPLPALQAAWRELVHASRALPGFETIDFRKSCCSLHQNAKHSSLGDRYG